MTRYKSYQGGKQLTKMSMYVHTATITDELHLWTAEQNYNAN